LFLFSGDERMSSSPVYENLQYRDVAVLVAVASVKAKSLDLMGRLTNPATFLLALADAVRIVRDDIVFSKNPTITQGRDEDGNPVVKIVVEESKKPVVIRGRLPSAEAVRRFIEEASMNIETAKKVAAHALYLLVEADESYRGAQS
jgi:CRISPR type I-A-associated protein Csa5